MDKHEWQNEAGATWAAQWRRTDRSFGQLTDRLLAELRGVAPAQVLDIGCGAGELSLAIARGHPDAQVLGVDVSPQLVATARERGEQLGNVGFACADAGEWRPEPGFAPDLLVSRHGVMFFADPPAAFANLAGLAAPGARLTFSCFRAPAANPFLTEVQRLLPEAPPPGDPHAPGPFAFADPQHVRTILRAGGWQDIAFAEVDFPMVAGAGEDPVADAVTYFTSIGPAARAVAGMAPAVRERFLSRVATMAERHCHEGIVALPAAAWIVSAHKP